MTLALILATAATAISANGDGAFMSSEFVKALLAGLAALGLGGGGYLAGKAKKVAIEPTPVPVKEEDKFITRGECKRLMCAHDAALSELRRDVKTGNINILHKLEAMDRKSEERAVAAHSRIEPLVKEISKNIGQVELIKESFLKSTVGGRK